MVMAVNDVVCPSCDRKISKKIAVYLADKAKAAGQPIPDFVQQRLARPPRASRQKPVKLPKEVQEALMKYDRLKARLERELGEHRAKALMEE
jgi:hypothetical protein